MEFGDLIREKLGVQKQQYYTMNKATSPTDSTCSGVSSSTSARPSTFVHVPTTSSSRINRGPEQGKNVRSSSSSSSTTCVPQRHNGQAPVPAGASRFNEGKSWVLHRQTTAWDKLPTDFKEAVVLYIERENLQIDKRLEKERDHLQGHERSKLKGKKILPFGEHQCREYSWVFERKWNWVDNWLLRKQAQGHLRHAHLRDLANFCASEKQRQDNVEWGNHQTNHSHASWKGHHRQHAHKGGGKGRPGPYSMGR
ncbi:unnamed protein product [Amoebophrya sp. A25]|nr:unnamed protein product [Amoebophrya sp. A25]|eukprot:GSA25T00002476001.1